MPLSSDGKMTRKRSRRREASESEPCSSQTFPTQQTPPPRSIVFGVRREHDGAHLDGAGALVGSTEFEVALTRKMAACISNANVTSVSVGSSAGTSAYKPPKSSQHQESSASEPLSSLFKCFRLNPEQRPLKIIRGSYQYLYDNTHSEYLDCVNSVSHVGHCHPAVVKAVSTSLECDIISNGLDIERGDVKYPDKLRNTLPDYLDTFLFCNSGSQAVDLSLQLAQLYTKGTDAIVADNAFHGSIDSVHHLSPKVFKANNITKADWVHIVDMPDLYRGQYQHQDPDAINKYISDAREVIENVSRSGKKVALFISEPMLIVPGIIIPPPTWLQEIYKLVREAGGLCIADEVQAGLGRVGSHFWSFQAQGVMPDILIVGKTVGNGYPMASVVTSREIASVLGDRIKEYECSRVMDAVGCAVFDVVENERLMMAADNVGTFLHMQLVSLQHKHEYIGEVRGRGLMLGLEIVWSKASKKPAQEVAEQIVYRMKEEYVILSNEGCQRNILMLMPPMCFTQDNALSLVERLDKVLSELPTLPYPQDHTLHLSSVSMTRQPVVCEGRIGIIQPQEEDTDDHTSNDGKDNMDMEYRRHNYQDLD